MNCKWIFSYQPEDYSYSCLKQEEYVTNILEKKSRNLIWVLCHNPLISLGPGAATSPILEPQNLEIYQTNRGGMATYHDPGQRIVYPIIYLGQNNIKKYIKFLEDWIKATLAIFKLEGFCLPDQPGVWLKNGKIAFIGIRVRRWVAFHGFSFNINPDLNGFNRIIPCGNPDLQITSLAQENVRIDLEEFDYALIKAWQKICKDF